MGTRTTVAVLAAVAVVAGIGWWALSKDEAAPAPAGGSGDSTKPAATSDDREPAAIPAPKPAPLPPKVERDGPAGSPDTPPPGARPSAPVPVPTVDRAPPAGGGRGGRAGRGGGAEGEDDEPAPVAPPGVPESVEEFRRLAITHALDFDAVFPRRGGWPKPDESRLERYPTPNAWPKVLGWVETNPSRYRVVSDIARGIGPKSSGGIVLAGPLASEITSEGSVTLLCRKGIAAEGTWVAKGYSTLLCQGDMAGKLFFGSYATAVVEGGVSGTVTAMSYFNLVVRGKFTGKLFTESYAMVHLLGGFEGDLELKGSKVYVKGNLPQAALERIRGSGYIYLDESDLAPGTHTVGSLTVYVGADSLAESKGK